MFVKFEEVMHPDSLDQTRLALTLFDVFALLKTDGCDFKLVSKTVQENPYFRNKILNKVNHNNYGFDKPIRDLQHAVGILGFDKVKNLLLAATERSFFHIYRHVEGHLFKMKKHAVAVACYCEEMARVTKQVYVPEFYQAGLMHDVGQYALVMRMGADYLKLIGEAEERNYSLYLHERDELKFDHAELGYQIALEWNLSEGIQKVIRYHHEIKEEDMPLLTTREEKLLAIVRFANIAHNGMGARSNRSLFRDYGSDLPTPPGDLTTTQLKMINEAASSRTMEMYRTLGLL